MEVISICQICQECKSVKAIFDLNPDVIKSVFRNTNYNVYSMICSKCCDTLEKLFEFKKTCLEVESKIQLMRGQRNRAHLEIGDVIGIGVKSEDFICNLSICRMCLGSNKNSASTVSVAEPNFKLMLDKCLPELNMNTVKDPVGCEKCFHMVEKYVFVLQCLEDRKVKSEGVYDEESSMSIDDIKQEELEIKDEQPDNNAEDFLNDNFENMYTALSSKELYEADTPNEFLMEEKHLPQAVVSHMHDREFDSLDTFEHMTINAELNQFACNTCKKCFATKSLLVRHMRRHTDRKTFKCDICNKVLTRKDHLKNHMVLHTGEKPINCDMCDKRFTRKRYLIRHMRIHASEKPFICFNCDKCDKSFTQKKKLIEHTKIHAGKNAFICDVCGKAFTRKDYLKSHILLHRGERPFNCDICSKTFTWNKHLKSHMKIHVGEKPFNCHLCNKGFMRNAHLIRHMLLHTDMKPFKCDTCDKKFAWKSFLITHMRVHTGEKPFKCDVCDKRFARKHYLIGHTRMHTGHKPFECDKCDKRFTRKDILITHNTRIHT